MQDFHKISKWLGVHSKCTQCLLGEGVKVCWTVFLKCRFRCIAILRRGLKIEIFEVLLWGEGRGPQNKKCTLCTLLIMLTIVDNPFGSTTLGHDAKLAGMKLKRVGQWSWVGRFREELELKKRNWKRRNWNWIKRNLIWKELKIELIEKNWPHPGQCCVWQLVTGQDLPVKELGFLSVIELMDSLSDIVSIERPSPSDWLLFDARLYKVKHTRKGWSMLVVWCTLCFSYLGHFSTELNYICCASLLNSILATFTRIIVFS